MGIEYRLTAPPALLSEFTDVFGPGSDLSAGAPVSMPHRFAVPDLRVAMVVLLYRLGLTSKRSLREYLVMAFGDSYVDRLYRP